MIQISQMNEAELIRTQHRYQQAINTPNINPVELAAFRRGLAAVNTRLNTLRSTPAKPVDNTLSTPFAPVESTPAATHSTPVESTPVEGAFRSLAHTLGSPSAAPKSTPESTPRPSVESTPVESTAKPVDNTPQHLGEVTQGEDGIPVWMHRKGDEVEIKTLAQVRSLVSAYGGRVRDAESRASCSGASCGAMDTLHRRVAILRYWQGAKDQLEEAHAQAYSRAINATQ